MIHLKYLFILTFIPFVSTSAVCYNCYGNNTSSGSFCSIDRMCTGSSCFFNYNSDGSWSAGCSTDLSSSSVIACSKSSGSGASCSCNSDFCNSFIKANDKLTTLFNNENSYWVDRNKKSSSPIQFALPNQTLIYCQECGTFSIDNVTFTIPCVHTNVCQSNYCVSIRGSTPYSYCSNDWTDSEHAACYLNDDEPERCVCSMNMCNILLDPQVPITTALPVSNDVTLATPKIVEPVESEVVTTTQKTAVTKKKCKTGKFSPNDQAVYMGEKLKDVILGGFGSEDGAVQNFEDDINDHICNYSEDEDEDEAAKK